MITSAALLLVIVIGAFSASDITFIKLLGVGMIVALSKVYGIPLTRRTAASLVRDYSIPVFAIKGEDTCTNPPMVQPGASCSIGIAFAPQTTGNFNAQLQFVDNAGNAAGVTQSVPLSGTGVLPSPAVNLAPTSLTFPAQIVANTSGPQTVTLTNTGSLSLQLSTISLAGTNASEFAFEPGTSCPSNGGTLAANAQCSVNVTFTPTSMGMQTAMISFSDNVSGSPQMVALISRMSHPPGRRAA